MKVSSIENNYRLWMAVAYFIAFLLQIPLLIEQMPSYIGVSTAFNTYTPSVIMIIFGCFLVILDRLMPRCGDQYRLQLFSVILLFVGSTVWCICGISWSSHLCAALFEENRTQRDNCWGSTFTNFFSISCMILYLAMSAIDDLFKPRARLIMMLFIHFVALIHLILYLVLNSFGPHQMTEHLKYYYYVLIIFIATTITVTLLSICAPHNHYTNNHAMLSFSLVFVSVVCVLLCSFLIVYGSYNYWSSQKINKGDGAAFIGYTVFYSTANLWIMIELYLYKKHRIEQNASSSSSMRYVRYDAINQTGYGGEHGTNIVV
eukprot:2758_1